jgi:hypothetical protein
LQNAEKSSEPAYRTVFAVDQENPKKRSVPALKRSLRIMEVLAKSRKGISTGSAS